MAKKTNTVPLTQSKLMIGAVIAFATGIYMMTGNNFPVANFFMGVSCACFLMSFFTP